MAKTSTLDTKDLFYWLGFCLGLIYGTHAQKCTPIDQCSCMMPDGKAITLWDIDKRYEIQSSDKSYSYLFRPCSGLDVPNSDCNGALGCQIGPSKKTAIAYKPKYVSVATDVGSNLKKFVYTGGMNEQLKKKFTFYVLLQCDETEEAKFLKMLGCNLGTCITQLNSKCACPGHCNLPKPNPGKGSNKKLGTGSILCITLLVLVLVYLIGGVAISKFILNKEGSEVIPQKAFWSDIPSLVKDGIIFTYQKVSKRKGDYQQI